MPRSAAEPRARLPAAGLRRSQPRSWPDPAPLRAAPLPAGPRVHVPPARPGRCKARQAATFHRCPRSPGVLRSLAREGPAPPAGPKAGTPHPPPRCPAASPSPYELLLRSQTQRTPTSAVPLVLVVFGKHTEVYSIFKIDFPDLLRQNSLDSIDHK